MGGAACIACLGSQYVDCVECFTLDDQRKLKEELGAGHLSNLEATCCKYHDLQCFSNGRCEIANQEVMKTNECTEICLPRSCGWITALKCSAKIALCAVACIETMGAACIACLGSQYVDCVECFTLDDQCKLKEELGAGHLTNLETTCCKYHDLQCFSNGRCEIANQEVMKTNGCTEICLPRSCGWITALKCSAKIALCAVACIETMGAACIAC